MQLAKGFAGFGERESSDEGGGAASTRVKVKRRPYSLSGDAGGRGPKLADGAAYAGRRAALGPGGLGGTATSPQLQRAGGAIRAGSEVARNGAGRNSCRDAADKASAALGARTTDTHCTTADITLTANRIGLRIVHPPRSRCGLQRMKPAT